MSSLVSLPPSYPSPTAGFSSTSASRGLFYNTNLTISLSLTPANKSCYPLDKVQIPRQVTRPHGLWSPASAAPCSLPRWPAPGKQDARSPFSEQALGWAFSPLGLCSHHPLSLLQSPFPSLLTEVLATLESPASQRPFCQSQMDLGLKFFVFLSLSPTEQCGLPCAPSCVPRIVPDILGGVLYMWGGSALASISHPGSGSRSSLLPWPGFAPVTAAAPALLPAQLQL